MDEDMLKAEDSPLVMPQPAKRGWRWVFEDKDGIRAGWGVLLFVLLFVGFEILTGWVLRHVLHGGHHSASLPVRLALITESAQLPALFLATGIMALIERRSVLAYGYQGTGRAVRFISGLVWGFVALSVLVLGLRMARLLVFDGEQLHGGAIGKYACAWALTFLVVAVFEESTLRGYLQYTLTRGIGFWWAALLLSLLFGFSHGTNPGESPVGLFSAAAIGLIFCLSLWYTGSLWWAVGFHASWDWAESYFYGTPDSGLIAQGHLLGEHPIGQRLWSGGATGPEGSLLVFGLLAIIWLLMWLWWGHKLQSPFSGCGWRPAWSRAWHRKPALDDTATPMEPAS